MKSQPAKERLVERGFHVGREDSQTPVGLHALQQVVDFDVGVAVVAVLDFAALAEQRVGFIEEQHDSAHVGSVEQPAKHSFPSRSMGLLTTAERSMRIEAQLQVVGQHLRGHGLAWSRWRLINSALDAQSAAGFFSRKPQVIVDLCPGSQPGRRSAAAGFVSAAREARCPPTSPWDRCSVPARRGGDARGRHSAVPQPLPQLLRLVLRQGLARHFANGRQAEVRSWPASTAGLSPAAFAEGGAPGGLAAPIWQRLGRFHHQAGDSQNGRPFLRVEEHQRVQPRQQKLHGLDARRLAFPGRRLQVESRGQQHASRCHSRAKASRSAACCGSMPVCNRYIRSPSCAATAAATISLLGVSRPTSCTAGSLRSWEAVLHRPRWCLPCRAARAARPAVRRFRAATPAPLTGRPGSSVPSGNSRCARRRAAR